MKTVFAYRPLAAFFLEALILQVFVLQGLHHAFGHRHDEPACTVEKTHFHAEGHGHISCELCLFHFAPSDLETGELSFRLPEALAPKAHFTYTGRPFAQSLRQTCLRGPPAHFS